jgi:hypothetical protein
MKTFLIEMIEDCGIFLKGTVYDASERTDGYVLFHREGWYLVPKGVCKIKD